MNKSNITTILVSVTIGILGTIGVGGLLKKNYCIPPQKYNSIANTISANTAKIAIQNVSNCSCNFSNMKGGSFTKQQLSDLIASNTSTDPNNDQLRPENDKIYYYFTCDQANGLNIILVGGKYNDTNLGGPPTEPLVIQSRPPYCPYTCSPFFP